MIIPGLMLFCAYCLFQTNPCPDNLFISFPNCASECCAPLRSVYLFSDQSAFEKWDGLPTADLTFAGTWRCEGNSIVIDFKSVMGGNGNGSPRQSEQYCNAVEYPQYKAFRRDTAFSVSLSLPEMNHPEPSFIRSPLNEKISRQTVSGFCMVTLTEEVPEQDASQLALMPDEELRILRNEIFARHGLIFRDETLMHHFSAQSWYKPRYTDVIAFLSETDKTNIRMIASEESRR